MRKAAKAGHIVTSHLLPTFARVDLGFERGEGAWLVATNGERYLDFTSGVAVNALGHAHPHVAQAIAEQAAKLIHVSNLFRIPEGERLAERLCAASGFAEYAFFCNSGAKAMEGAIKCARKYHAVNGAPERVRIITFEGAFHGRTLATLAAGGQKKYLEGFGPVVEGFDQVPFGDLAAVKRAIGPTTAAILIEPIQGEGGGVHVVDNQFLRELRELCDTNGLLLVLDEVQTGMGRTGDLFAFQHTGVTPDIMALAKALGGGFPMGAFLTTAAAGKGMTAGTHGSTFGGNPLAMAAGNATLDVMLAPGFFDKMRRNALLLKQRLAEIKDRHRRDPRRRLSGRVARDGAERPARRCAADREGARGRSRRQRGAAATAADRQRGRDRRGDRPARPRRHRARARGRQSTGGAGGDRMSVAAIRHFLDLIDIPPRERSGIIEASRAMKKRVRGRAARPLDGRTLAMIFDKPSTRTRVSLNVAKDRNNV
jgi:acetylornithine/N-succinyldiaminopimelate aminotransferase